MVRFMVKLLPSIPKHEVIFRSFMYAWLQLHDGSLNWEVLDSFGEPHALEPRICERLYGQDI
jgi:hypothetical protein